MGAEHSLRLPFGKPRFTFGKPCGMDGGEWGGGGGGWVFAAGSWVCGWVTGICSYRGHFYSDISVMVLPYHYIGTGCACGCSTNKENRGEAPAFIALHSIVAYAIVAYTTIFTNVNRLFTFVNCQM